MAVEINNASSKRFCCIEELESLREGLLSENLTLPDHNRQDGMDGNALTYAAQANFHAMRHGALSLPLRILNRWERIDKMAEAGVKLLAYKT